MMPTPIAEPRRTFGRRDVFAIAAASARPAWPELVAGEPMLSALLDSARGESGRALAAPVYCRWDRWLSAFEPALARLRLEHGAEIVARRELLAALPACHGCRCAAADADAPEPPESAEPPAPTAEPVRIAPGWLAADAPRFIGVWRDPRSRSRPWMARARHRHVGCYATPEEAARARDAALIADPDAKHVRLNFPDLSGAPAGAVPVPLGTCGLVAFVDAADAPDVLRHRWYARWEYGKPYAMATIGGRRVQLSRLLMPACRRATWRNGNTLDCRRCNVVPAAGMPGTCGAMTAAGQPCRRNRTPGADGCRWHRTPDPGQHISAAEHQQRQADEQPSDAAEGDRP